MFRRFYNNVQLIRSIAFSPGFYATNPNKLLLTQCFRGNPPLLRMQGNIAQSDTKEMADNEKEKERAIKIRMIKLEIIKRYMNSGRAPSFESISDKDMNILLTMDKVTRAKYYMELLQKEKRKRLKPVFKQIKLEENKKAHIAVREARASNQHLVYAVGHNSLFPRIRPHVVRRIQDRRLFRAKMFGPRLIIDCSFNNNLSFYGQRKVATQLRDCFKTNRSNLHPFDLHLCNFDVTGNTAELLKKTQPRHFDRAPVDMHRECFTELFPKDRLVYITPDCETDLVDVNHQDIYVIGSISSIHESREVVLAQAKQSGVRMARLPIEHFLTWNYGDKALTPSELLMVLLGIKASGSWETAFQYLNSSKFDIK